MCLQSVSIDVVEPGTGGLQIEIADGPDGVALIGPISLGIEVLPARSDGGHDFLAGAFVAVTRDGRRYVRDHGCSIDTLRFANFRDDLITLERARVGSIHIGDHDFYEVITLIADGDVVQVEFTDAGKDVWNREVTSIAWANLSRIIEQLDAIDRQFGPLTGCCGVCSEPWLTYNADQRAIHAFLVSYDYGEGIVRSVVFADSEDAITAEYPELTILRNWPSDLSDAQYEALPFVRLDSVPTGILTMVIDNRPA